MEHTRNMITIRGYLQDHPRFSHENHGRRFHRFFLEIPRLSGAVDVLPVVIPEQAFSPEDLWPGCMLTITGQIRSHNQYSGGSRHLMVFIFADSLLPEDGSPINDVMIEGNLCKEPVFRRTPLGREICDIMVAVPRAFRRADYLPCILWGRTAQEASVCRVSQCIRVYGRLQSRIYTKLTEAGAIERTTYEISALRAEIPENM